MGKRILALLFDLERVDGLRVLLTAWLDDSGNGEFLTPVHPDKTLLDVTAGDDVIHNRETRYTVRRLKPWRTSECKDERAYSEVRCGREWEAGG